MYFYQIDCYERTIREPDHQQDKTAINCYVHLCLAATKQCQNKQEANLIYFRMVRTFEEIICDDLLTHTWRQHSFKAFKQIKPILFEIMTRSEYAALSSKFERLGDYFLRPENTSLSVQAQPNPK